MSDIVELQIPFKSLLDAIPSLGLEEKLKLLSTYTKLVTHNVPAL